MTATTILSDDMRASISVRLRRRIPILHRNGGFYLLSPNSERLQKVEPKSMPVFEPYQSDA